MRKIPISALLGLAIMSFPYAVLSQNISYAYDNCGNCIKREIRINTKNTPGCSDVNEIHVLETLSDRSIRIYPNPTKGNLKIEIVGYEPYDDGQVSLFSLAGQQLFSVPVSSAYIQLDLNDQTHGIYILHIYLNGKASSWKIIKK